MQQSRVLDWFPGIKGTLIILTSTSLIRARTQRQAKSEFIEICSFYLLCKKQDPILDISALRPVGHLKFVMNTRSALTDVLLLIVRRSPRVSGEIDG